MTARQVGEDLRSELVSALNRHVGLFDSDPELDDHDPDYGAHLQAVGSTRTVVVDIPNVGERFWGRWASADELHEQPLTRAEVVGFFRAALV